MREPNWKKIKKDIGGKVSKARSESELTLDKFSQKADISKEVLHRIEKGKTLASTRTLYKIAHFLKIKIMELLP